MEKSDMSLQPDDEDSLPSTLREWAKHRLLSKNLNWTRITITISHMNWFILSILCFKNTHFSLKWVSYTSIVKLLRNMSIWVSLNEMSYLRFHLMLSKNKASKDEHVFPKLH